MKTKISLLSIMLSTSMLVSAAIYEGTMKMSFMEGVFSEPSAIKIDLSESDGFYSITNAGAMLIDQLVLDSESENFSREGFFTQEGSSMVASLISGYTKGDSLIFQLNYEPETSGSLAYMTEFRGKLLTYNEVTSSQELYDNYAQEINISDIPFNLHGDYDVYNTTNGNYLKCFKVYLTPDDMFDVKCLLSDIYIQSELGDYLLVPTVSNWGIIPNSADEIAGKYAAGYYYITFFSSDPTVGYRARFTPHIDPIDVILEENLKEDYLKVTEINGNTYTEVAGYFGNEKCSLLDFNGYYYNSLVYKCELREGDKIAVQVSGFNPQMPTSTKIYKSNFSHVTTIFGMSSIGNINYTATEDDIYYFIISSNEERSYDNYDAFNIQINRAYPSDFIVDEDDVLIGYIGTDADIVVPFGIKEIDGELFRDNSHINSIVLPETVTRIGIGAFHNSSLTSVMIPNSVTYIGAYAFDCLNLQEINVSWTNPQSIADGGNIGYGSNIFRSVPTSCMVNYPAGMLEAYQIEPWLYFDNIKGDNTSVSTLYASEPDFYVSDGNIIVKNTTETVFVFDVCGRCISIGKSTIIVPQVGVYVVRVGEIVEKVVVR